jgi:hypothetical protein
MKPLYIHIPKNAGISIKNSLIDSCNYPKIFEGHLTCQQLKARASLFDYKYDNIFTTVRNPFTRMVSIFLFLKLKSERYSHYFFKTDLTLPFKIYSFKHFINYFLYDNSENFHYMNTYMFLPQKTWLDTNDNVNIFKFENINKIEKFLNLKLKHFNKNEVKINYKDFYDAKTKNIVFKNFEIDFDIFKYPSFF